MWISGVNIGTIPTNPRPVGWGNNQADVPVAGTVVRLGRGRQKRTGDQQWVPLADGVADGSAPWARVTREWAGTPEFGRLSTPELRK